MQKLSGEASITGNRLPAAPEQAHPRVLILGGTGEGAELAACLAERQDITVVSSLAGRVAEPRLPEGLVRVGGFGGVDGLALYLVNEKIAAVIDATHPFAARISRNAEAACTRTGVPLILLARPAWKSIEGDQWHEVADFRSAAQFIDAKDARVFLSIGRQELEAFSDCKDTWFLIRVIDEPSGPLPQNHKLLFRRGPFSFEDEVQLLRDHSIDYVVSKNSGGPATYSKIEACRSLGIPVVMIGRPFKYASQPVETVQEAIVALGRILIDKF
ncbi:precorrin-6A/cobalt-precorrin-6A reductase [Silvibacterium bohemicum]|uniref:Precorrin-6A/cobalt-precorrin-6A reductase n=1 Tax=Silvibacterium bohemicum TaxID=1577686 RepID=A0A841K055_9BACT|nr:cobalt-precorrin-6A reductase [Silvibacterium bohemicum]MBB6145339.1 precorrin-6A/cobalt-precorrin-6A reductase [Silvibacterium bohemicum]